MKKGYYTNEKGHVLGYFELPEVPLNDDKYVWIETDEKPELYVSPEVLKERRIEERKSFLDRTDYKIIKKLEKFLSSDDPDVLERQTKRDQINELELS